MRTDLPSVRKRDCAETCVDKVDIATSCPQLWNLSLVPNALSQRREIIFRQGHRYACAGRPSPEVAHHTADEPLAKSVDLDERSIAASAGMGRSYPLLNTSAPCFPSASLPVFLGSILISST